MIGIIIGVCGLFLAVLICMLIRTLLIKPSKKINQNHISSYSGEENMRYALLLKEWIQCKTISKRESFDDQEFIKLWDIQKRQFPHLFNCSERLIFDKGCQILKVKGKDESRNIMLMSHCDVVNASGDWKYPPFDGVIAEEYLWGRGTIDTKTPLFAEMMALEELLSNGFIPEVNVYIGSSHNEEIMGLGMPKAVKYFENNNIHFELVIDEGGAVLESPMPGIDHKFAMLAIHEKGRRCLKLTSKIHYGHFGLSPSGDTPIIKMSKLICEINNNKKLVKRFYPTVLEMFRSLRPYMKFSMRFIFCNLWFFKPILLKVLPKISPQAGTMLGSTCYFTTISGGKEAQIQAKEVESIAFLRGIDFEDLEKDTSTIHELAEKYKIDVETIFDEFPLPSSFKSGPYKRIKQTIYEIFPDVEVAPFILPAGSDARHFTKISDNVIRFAPITLSNEQFSSVHNPNERIHLQSIGQAVLFYKQLVKNYQ